MHAGTGEPVAATADGGPATAELLTLEQAGARLGVSRGTVYQLIGDSRLRSVKVGRSRRIVAKSLGEYVAWLEARS